MTNTRFTESRNKREGWYAGWLYRFFKDGSCTLKVRTKIRNLSLKSTLLNKDKT